MEQYNEGTSIFNEAQSQAYAGFWERFGAAILDGLIMSAVGFLINLAFGVNMADMFRRGMTPGAVIASYASGANIATVVLNWLYYALQESGPMQATLGKRALGIKVVGAGGQRISFANATGRFFGKYISTIICCIGYLFPLWDARRQALHDKIANTFVVNA